jgi:hypothetical protein
MDMILGGLAFAALIFGQFAAVIAVHGENSRTAEPRETARPDYRARLILEGGG